MDKLERLKKYANGGKVAKFKNPAGPIIPGLEDITNQALESVEAKYEKEAATLAQRNYNALKMMSGTDSDQASQQMLTAPQVGLTTTKLTPSLDLKWNNETNKAEGNVNIQQEEYTPGVLKVTSPEIKDVKGNAGLNYTMSPTDASAAILALNATDQALMGDKNFSAGSQALDSVVHGASGALMKSGNPWAMGAAVALEGLNFITKAGGRTVQGYDVNILNSGYGNMGHQESESGRIWDKWSGATARKLARRNEQARMALAAAEISNDVAFEQEARANSVDDILRQNTIALNGGIDTSLLGS